MALCLVNIPHLLSAHEQNVLYSMSNTRQIFHVAEATHVDVHGRRGLLGVGIVDEQSFELIGQPDDPVGATIEE